MSRIQFNFLSNKNFYSAQECNRNVQIPLFNSSGKNKYFCNSLVIMGILDHFSRRSTNQKYNYGILLGKVFEEDKDDKSILITNCFPLVNSSYNDNEVKIDSSFEELILGLYNDISFEEKFVGWYTNNNVNDAITNFYHLNSGKFMDFAKPILLCVNTDLKTSNLSIQAYISDILSYNKLDDNGKEVEKCKLLIKFIDVPLFLVSSNAEKIGIDTLISGSPEDHEVFDSPSYFASNIDVLCFSLANLISNFEKVEFFIEKITKGSIILDCETELKINQELQEITKFDYRKFKNYILSNIQDHMMFIYLLNLTRNQLSLSNGISRML